MNYRTLRHDTGAVDIVTDRPIAVLDGTSIRVHLPGTTRVPMVSFERFTEGDVVSPVLDDFWTLFGDRIEDVEVYERQPMTSDGGGWFGRYGFVVYLKHARVT